jgi:hypothetical protein
MTIEKFVRPTLLQDNAEWPALCVAMAGNKDSNLFKMIYMPLTIQNFLKPSAIPKFYLNI